jgi:DNA-binding GntR family transcriptional regulator
LPESIISRIIGCTAFVSREEHIAIVDALADNQTDVATVLLREHIRSSMRRMISDMPSANGAVDLPK